MIPQTLWKDIEIHMRFEMVCLYLGLQTPIYMHCNSDVYWFTIVVVVIIIIVNFVAFSLKQSFVEGLEKKHDDLVKTLFYGKKLRVTVPRRKWI